MPCRATTAGLYRRTCWLNCTGFAAGLTQLWAKRGSWPAAPRDCRCSWSYLFGAVCPARGIGAALVLPCVSTTNLNLPLAEISRDVAAGAHAVVTLDGAGWHKPGDTLNVPANISLLPLPPHSPELNSVGNIWQYLRKNQLANRVLENYDTIVQACCDAWNRLIAQPERITSISTRTWAQAINI